MPPQHPRHPRGHLPACPQHDTQPVSPPLARLRDCTTPSLWLDVVLPGVLVFAALTLALAAFAVLFRLIAGNEARAADAVSLLPVSLNFAVAVAQVIVILLITLACAGVVAGVRYVHRRHSTAWATCLGAVAGAGLIVLLYHL